MSKKDAIIKQALNLSTQDKISLIEKLIASLQESDPELESLWKKEVENRIDAWEKGDVPSLSVEEVMQQFKISNE